jgi:predicted RNA-binding protein with EMAP domain
MTYDTSTDPRLLVARRACAVIRKGLQQKTAARPSVSKERVTELAAAAESAVMTLLYTYQEPEQLAASEHVAEIVTSSSELTEALAPLLSSSDSPLLRASLGWGLRVLSGLPARLATPGTALASGVDLKAVEVRNVTAAGTLWRTLVSDGEHEYTVVTNLSGIRRGDVLAAAFLPPRDVGGVVSEAMFLGDERRSEAPGTILDADQIDTREAAGILHEELHRQ